MSDIYYLMVFTGIFLTIGIFAPFMNETFDTDYTEHDIDGILGASENSTVEGYISIFEIMNPLIPVSFITGLFNNDVIQLLGNIIALPFWTFGFPAWVNLKVLIFLRIPYVFLIWRNVFGKGGG